jgi:hypothetical protein
MDTDRYGPLDGGTPRRQSVAMAWEAAEHGISIEEGDE